jgi:hypothetical protein
VTAARAGGTVPVRAVTRVAAAAAVVFCAIAACSGADVRSTVGDGRAALQGADTMGVLPGNVIRIETQARKELIENSGTTLSPAQAGVLFAINDSGNDPLLFALDTTGAERGVWRIAGARNSDWEAVSVGPCGARAKDTADSASTRTAPDGCVYIGDVGDNAATYRTRIIYRVPEPTAQQSGFVGDLRADRLRFRYADHPHDVEAMYVAPNGDTYLITKRRLVARGNRVRPALVFRLAAAAWGRDTAVAELVDSLPIVPGSAPNRQITDASLSPDGRWLLVRTYTQVYVFATDSATARVRGAIPPAVCNVASLGRSQGEGITWFGRSGKLLLTSEGQRSPMFAIDCPMPRSD